MKKYFVLPFVILIAAVFSSVLFSPVNFSEAEWELKHTKEKPGPDQRPFEWAWMQRTFPYFNADFSVYKEAAEKVKEMKKEKALRLNKTFTDNEWEFAGPVNIGGRVVDIEFNPVDPSIVYAASATGGVFKSTDTGLTWFPIFDDLAVLTIGDIAINPLDPEIIYVGTGEPNGGHNNFPGSGMFKSTNGGSDWEFIGLGNTAAIGRIIIHPANPQIVYAAAVGSYFAHNEERGVYKTTDGGLTWEISLFVSDTTGAIDIVIDPNNPDFLMAAMWERVRRVNSSHLYGPSSGIYTTTNGGTSWNLLGPSTGLPDAAFENIGRIGLAISRSSPNIIYALYNDGYNYSGLYKTTNYGSNWTNVDTDSEISEGTSNFSWFFGQVRVHPQNPNTVFVMDVAFMRSTNSGNSWPIIYGYGGPGQLHVDHHALAFHPQNPNYIINGNDGGINISTDGGVNWSQPAQLPATQFYEIGLDRTNPQKLYGGTQDNNTIRTNTGAIDDWDRILGGDGFYVIVDPTNPNIIYAESQFGNLAKSTNGGLSFNYALNGINQSQPTNWSTPVIMDPNNNNILYYGTDRVYRTTNGAQNWTVISGDLTDGIPGTRLGTVTTIAVAPTNSNVIYAGTDDSHVWVTTDYGTTWTDVSAALPYRWVTRVIVDPKNESIVYATFSGMKWKDPQPHVFRSTDKGNSWADISGSLPDAPVNAFAVDLVNSEILYLGSDVGAFVSTNSGESWDVLGIGLPTVSVYDMKIHPVQNYLAAGTYGRSMYRISLGDPLPVQDKILVNSFSLEQNYPNPFNPTTRIRFSISDFQFTSLKIYDITGKEIAALIDEIKSPGSYEVEFNGSSLSSGVYFYKLTSGNFSAAKKFILMK